MPMSFLKFKDITDKKRYIIINPSLFNGGMSSDVSLHAAAKTVIRHLSY
jgi:hypothetical protein